MPVSMAWLARHGTSKGKAKIANPKMLEFTLTPAGASALFW